MDGFVGMWGLGEVEGVFEGFLIFLGGFFGIIFWVEKEEYWVRIELYYFLIFLSNLNITPQPPNLTRIFT